MGTKYVFSIKDPQPEDAGFYQVDVDEANVLTTDFKGKVQLMKLQTLDTVHAKEPVAPPPATVFHLLQALLVS